VIRLLLRVSLSVVALWAVALSGACASVPHVTLPTAPDTSAPYAERAAYYKKAALDGYDGNRVTLHDGTFVYWPEDLKPAVSPDSHTAKAIDNVVKARSELEPAGMITTGGSIVALGGLGAMAVAAGLTSFGAYENLLLSSVIMVGGLGGVAAGVAVALAPSVLFGPQFQALADAQQQVLTTYPQSLADRVAIQPDANGMLVDLAGEQKTETAGDDSRRTGRQTL
jgi:hypothetical protein